MDTGPSDHLVKYGTPEINRRKLSQLVKIRVAKSESFMLAKEMGDVLGSTAVNGEVRRLELKKVYLIDNLEYNLISLPTLEKEGFRIVIENGECQIQMGKDLVPVGKRDGKLYRMKFVVDDKGERGACLAGGDGGISHRRMGHIGGDALKKVSMAEDGCGEIKGVDKSRAIFVF